METMRTSSGRHLDGPAPPRQGRRPDTKAAACDSTREKRPEQGRPETGAGKQVTGCQEPVTAGAGSLGGDGTPLELRQWWLLQRPRDHTPQKLAVKARFPLEGKTTRLYKQVLHEADNSLDAGLCQACYSAFQKKNLKKTKHCFNTCREGRRCLEAPRCSLESSDLCQLSALLPAQSTGKTALLRRKRVTVLALMRQLLFVPGGPEKSLKFEPKKTHEHRPAPN